MIYYHGNNENKPFYPKLNVMPYNGHIFLDPMSHNMV